MLNFATFQLDVDGRRLLRDGSQVPLEPQAFDVLALLVEHRDRVVPKEEILDTVWGDRWVSESALTTRIKEVRRAVGDTGEVQGVVRTVRGRGYQFVASEVVPERAYGGSTSELIGRGRDVESLAQRLHTGSLVTLVGPGGVGKTTLGRSLASHLRGSFRDGCFAIDLTVVRDRDELFAVVARALQIVDANPETLPALLASFDALLLLDDADELVSEVADLCTAITSGDSRVTLLVTCRERLGAPGEQIWPVLPLASEDAVELLQVRAAQLAPLGSLVGAATDTLSELTRIVDDLPLAIEMLASASAYLGRAELIELVTSTPENLTDPRRNAPSRHRSLEALVTASVDRLDATSLGALEVLSSFAGPFRLADATDICGLGADGLRVVSGLIDRSLLAPSIGDSQGPRFQMLRTVGRAVRRQMGQERLQSCQRRHAVWVAQELERADQLLRSAAERAGSDRFGALSDDARVAHAWAREHDIELALAMTASLHLYAHSRLWAEPAQWAETIPRWRAHGRALAAAASQASQEARFDDAAELAALALQDADARVQAWALEALSDVEIYRGELATAITHADQLVALGVTHGDPRMIALGTTNGALARAYLRDTQGALEHLDRHPWEGPRSQAPTDLAWLELSRGETLGILGRTHEAVQHLERATALGREADSRFIAVVARTDLGSIQQGSGELAEAATTYRELIGTFHRYGIVTHLTITLRNTTPLLVAVGCDREAAVVSGWLLSQDVRAGYGPDPLMVEEARDDVRARHPESAAAWESEGASLNAFEVADLTLAALAMASATRPGRH